MAFVDPPAACKIDRERVLIALRDSQTTVWEWNLGSGDFYEAPDGYSILGEPAPTGTNRSISDWLWRVHPDERETIAQATIALCKGQSEHLDATYRVIDALGGLRWMRSRGTVSMRAEDGRPARVTGTHMDVTDVTARLVTLEKRQGESDLLDQVVDIVPAPLWITDAAGSICKVNRAFETLVEREREVLLGKTWSKLFPEAVSTWAEQQDLCLIEHPGDQTYELSITMLDGRTKALEVRKTTLRAPDGKGAAVVGTARDIGALKLELQAVRGAKEALDTVESSQSELLDSLGHEVRTPMNGVVGMIDLSLEGDLSPTQREQLTQAKDSAAGLLSLFDDLSGLARVKSNLISIEPEYFDLRVELSKLLRMMRPGAVRKDLTLAGVVDDAVPEKLVGDIKRLRQVLVNLLSNAVKFTRRGNIALRVTLDEVGEAYPQGSALGIRSGIRLLFSISDTGVGIAPKILPLLWTPHEDTSLYFGGHGLRVARYLVKGMQGTLDVRSVLGRGTEVLVTLPLGVAEQSSMGAPENPVSLVAEKSSDDDLWPHRASPQQVETAQALRVLVVEDAPINQALLVAVLKRMGHSVLAVGDGRAAVDVFLQQPYDLVLMDVRLPVLDGLEATRQIRSIQNEKGLWSPIIGVTAQSLATDREACLDAGMDDVLVKPINRAQLEAILLDIAEGALKRASATHPH